MASKVNKEVLKRWIGGVEMSDKRLSSSRSPDVIEMVEEFLSRHGFDGLFNSEAGCGCVIGDLQPCCYISECCKAGIKKTCMSSDGLASGECSVCENDIVMDGQWHIVENINSEIEGEE